MPPARSGLRDPNRSRSRWWSASDEQGTGEARRARLHPRRAADGHGGAGASHGRALPHASGGADRLPLRRRTRRGPAERAGRARADAPGAADGELGRDVERERRQVHVPGRHRRVGHRRVQPQRHEPPAQPDRPGSRRATRYPRRWRDDLRGDLLRHQQCRDDHRRERLRRGHLDHDTLGRRSSRLLLAGESPGHRCRPREAEERMMRIRIPITDERGIAFPMAMIVLTVLMALMAAFAFLATSEPQIAANHMASVQARSLAESGLERALWALTQGEASPAPAGTLVNSGPPNYTLAIPPPYDGSTFVSVSSAGGFKVTVSELTPPVINQKVVTAAGFVPNDTNPAAVKKITAKVTRIKWIDPYCGLCAGAETPPGGATEIDVGGNATVNGSGSSHNVGGRNGGGGGQLKKKGKLKSEERGGGGGSGIRQKKGNPHHINPDGRHS